MSIVSTNFNADIGLLLPRASRPVGMHEVSSFRTIEIHPDPIATRILVQSGSAFLSAQVLSEKDAQNNHKQKPEQREQSFLAQNNLSCAVGTYHV